MADEKDAIADTAAPTEGAAGSEPATAEPTTTAPAPGQPEAAAAQPPGAQELADMKDRLLRTLAEMENLRQRTAREMADTRQYAVANFAREMLAVGDNLRRAIDAVPKETREAADKALAALIEGVEVTERALQQVLTRFGVKRIEARGEKFNPEIHQAMFEVDSDAVEPGQVAEEVQAGYVIGERVLRPSLVAIAKKPAKPGANAAPVEDDAAKPAEPPASRDNDAA